MSDDKSKEEKTLFNIGDLTGLSKPLEKLFDIINKTLGKCAAPFFIRKIADANAYELSVMQETLKNNKAEITIERNGTKIHLTNEPEKIVLNSILEKEAKKLENQSKIIKNTAEILETKESVSEKPLDNDWITRFFKITEDITTEEMQNLWSKILADEIEKPNSYSLRTLETLKNLSSKEAKLFSLFVKICCFPGRNKKLIAINDSDFLKKYNITLEDMQLLEELNLVNSLLGFNIHPNTECPLIYCDKLILIKNNSNNKIYFPVYTLTTIGQEISTIIEKEFYLSFPKDVHYYFKKQGNISSYIVDLNKNDFSYNPKNMIEIH